MAIRDKRKVEAALAKKGFVKISKDHKVWMLKRPDGKAGNVKTKTSHGSGNKVLSDTLFSVMARQCHLNVEQFCALIDCSLSEEDYRKILRKKRITI